MSDLKVEQKIENGEVHIYLTGPVNEFAELPPLPANPSINIHLENVTGLNSIGTRNWVRWMKTKPPLSFIYIYGAPPIFVKGFNTVAGMNALNLKIMSFIVPYYSEESGERQNVLFERDVHFQSAFKIKPPEILDSKGQPMEMDVLTEYFGFLGP